MRERGGGLATALNNLIYFATNRTTNRNRNGNRLHGKEKDT